MIIALTRFGFLKSGDCRLSPSIKCLGRGRRMTTRKKEKRAFTISSKSLFLQLKNKSRF